QILLRKNFGDPIRHWHSGRVTLLGDAAHPTLRRHAIARVLSTSQPAARCPVFRPWRWQPSRGLDRSPSQQVFLCSSALFLPPRLALINNEPLALTMLVRAPEMASASATKRRRDCQVGYRCRPAIHARGSPDLLPPAQQPRNERFARCTVKCRETVGCHHVA